MRVTDRAGTRVITLPLEEYVLGAVRAELPPSTLTDASASGALQVQAVISRTYAIASLGRHAAEGFDVCDGTHCQVYRTAAAGEGPADNAARAVADTRDTVVTYGGRVIQALFHSNCGGHTTSAGPVWGGPDEPYLQPVTDESCAKTSPGNWTYAISEAELRRALNSDARTEVGARLNRIDVAVRDQSGRAALVALAGSRAPLVRAEELREVVRRTFGPNSLRSTWFTVEQRGDRFVFAGVGYGHGVGMCQVGAALRARAGQSPIDIITHYFPGTRIESTAMARLAAPWPFSAAEIP